MKKAELLAEQQRLLTLANELTQKHWGVDYTGGLVLFKRKWKRREACFAHKVDRSVCEIRMSVYKNADLPEEVVTGNLLHELVHWRLYTLDLPLDDADPEFISECLRVGAPLSGATSAQKAYEKYLQAAKSKSA